MEGATGREEVRVAVRRLLEEDRAAGRVRDLDEYRAMFPGHWDVVAREVRAFAERSRKVASSATVVAGAAGAGTGSVADAGPEAVRVGPYRVLREIGRGGMGVVHEAVDTRLPRRVALKVLAPQFAASDALRLRFEREASVAARLDHPGIATVYEAGTADGIAYIAMRFVEGVPLSERIAGARAAGGPPHAVTVTPAAGAGAAATGATTPPTAAPESGRGGLDRVLLFFENAARALHHAHERGLVHRDVKPANLMVTPEGDPVLLDFGLAREEAGDGHGLTQTGHLMGTPAYMSPEQLTAQRIRLDRRTDVYSLGASLYEAVTLRLPFEAPTREGLYKQILTTDPEDPRRLNPEVPADLRVVIDTAMEKDRDRRYATAHEFAEELRRVRSREPVLARPAGTVTRLWRWAERSPGAARAGAVVILLGVGLGATSHHVVRKERDARDVALEGQRAQTEATRLALRREAEARREAEVARDAAAVALRRARALGLASASAEAEESDPMLALQLAVEAARRETLPAVVQRLHGALAAARERAVVRHGTPVTAAAWSPSGDRIVTASADGRTLLSDADGRPLVALEGHAGAVPSLAWSAAGDRILTASLDGTARLWSSDGRPLAVLRGDSGALLVAAALPDGGWVTGGADGAVRVWTRGGDARAVLRGHSGEVTHVDVARDGGLLASGGTDATVRLWTPAGESRGSFAEDGPVIVLRFDAAGERLLTAGADRRGSPKGVVHRVRVRDLTGAVLGTIEGFVNFIADAAWSPDGTLVAVHCREGSLTTWRPDGTAVHGSSVHPLSDGRVSFSPDGMLLAAACGDNAVHVYDGAGAAGPVLRGHVATTEFAAFSPDGASLLTASEDGTARLWTLDPGELAVALPLGRWRRPSAVMADDAGRAAFWAHGGAEVVVLDGSLRPLAAVRDIDGGVRSVSADRRLALLAVTTAAGGGLLLEGATGRRIADLASPGDPLDWLAVSPAGDRILAASRGGALSLYAPDGSALPAPAGAAAGSVTALVWSEDGSRFAVADARETGVFRADGAPVGRFPSMPTPGIAMDRTGSRVALACGPGFRLHAADGALLLEAEPHSNAVRRVALSPDGATVATGSMDLTARLTPADGGPGVTLRGHRAEILQLTFLDDDGARVATAANRDSVRVWTRDGALLHELRVEGSPLWRAARARAAPRMLTTHETGHARLWTLDAAELLRVAEDRITRPMHADAAARHADLLGE